MKHRVFLAILLAAGFVQAQDQSGSKRAIQLTDVLAWKRVQQPMISGDGQWFVYRLSPNEGDSEVVIRSMKDGKEQRFAIGEIPTAAAGPAGPPPAAFRDLQISEDSKWVAFLVYPTQKEAKALAEAEEASAGEASHTG